VGKLVQWCQLKEASMSRFITSFLKNESGATAIEYGLIAGLIAVAIIVTVTTTGGAVSTTFGTVAGAL
jgi:pilus assembly protein Flp/PilA